MSGALYKVYTGSSLQLDIVNILKYIILNLLCNWYENTFIVAFLSRQYKSVKLTQTSTKWHDTIVKAINKTIIMTQ